MRIFIALLFSPAINNEICDIIDMIKEKNYHGHPTAHDNLHLTLHYIGETKEEKLKEIIKQLKKIKLNNFVIKTHAINAFEKGKKILYLGLEENSELIDLHNEVIKHLNAVGYDIDKQKYIPHITLMKRVVIEDDEMSILEFMNFEIDVNSISIMESKRVKQKLVYEEIERITLKK